MPTNGRECVLDGHKFSPTFPYEGLHLTQGSPMVYRKQKGTDGNGGNKVGNLSDPKATTQVLHYLISTVLES